MHKCQLIFNCMYFSLLLSYCVFTFLYKNNLFIKKEDKARKQIMISLREKKVDTWYFYYDDMSEYLKKKRVVLMK